MCIRDRRRRQRHSARTHRPTCQLAAATALTGHGALKAQSLVVSLLQVRMCSFKIPYSDAVSYTHLRAHETSAHL
eukprot:8952895-Alexandrium_andersonii.AAC.1